MIIILQLGGEGGGRPHLVKAGFLAFIATDARLAQPLSAYNLNENNQLLTINHNKRLENNFTSYEIHVQIIYIKYLFIEF